MRRDAFVIVALAFILALTSWAASNPAADTSDSGQTELAALHARVTQLQERVARVERQVEEFSQPKLRPVEGR